MKNPQESLIGVAHASIAFLIWGVSPIYFKELNSISAFEITMHRVIWSYLFLLITLVLQRRWNEFIASLKNVRILLILLPSTVLLGTHWLIYVWSVNTENILQATIGYFIHPLVFAFLGMIFLRERPRPLQIISLIFVMVGVLFLIFHYGRFPWIALSIAFTFGFYGLIRKVAPVGSLIGLSIELLFLIPFAVVYVFYLAAEGTGVFFCQSFKIDFFLVGTPLFTALPLLLFTLGTRCLNLITVGLIEYITPTCMFFLGVFLYGEPLLKRQMIVFVLLWTAIFIYSTDSVIYYRRKLKLPKAY